MLAIEIRGLTELMEKVDPGILNRPVRRFLERSGEAVAGKAKERAPVDDGRMRASIGSRGPEGIWEMAGGSPPGYLKVGTGVNRAGFSYPLHLEESPVTHYARGARKGSPTRGWFSEGVREAVSAVGRFVKTLGREIREEAGWK